MSTSEPTLKQLAYLAALDAERHFRRAAERVGVTQPTLSAQLQALERTLDASLIDRSAGGVELTALGREVAEHARRMLADALAIRDLAAAAQHGLVGTLRLGAPPTLGPYLLPRIVPALHARHPNLKLYVREGKPRDLQADLQAGRFDLVLSPLPVAEGDLEVARLFREPLWLAAPLEHPLAATPADAPLAPASLAGCQVLTIEPGHHLHEQVRALCRDLGATLRRDYEGTSLDTLRLMVAMGVGVAFLPALYVRSEIADRGEVAMRRLGGASVFRQVGLVWRRRSAQAAQFAEIAELIRAEAAARLPEVTVTR